MQKKIDKKGNAYYKILNIPYTYYSSQGYSESGDLYPKNFTIFEKEDRLIFFPYMCRKQRNIKTWETVDPPYKFVLSFKNKRVNLYKINGKSCINITNHAAQLDYIITEFLQRYHLVYKEKFKHKQNIQQAAKRASITKLIYKKAKQNGIKIKKLDCRYYSPGTLIMRVAYPILQEIQPLRVEKKTMKAKPVSPDIIEACFSSIAPQTLESNIIPTQKFEFSKLAPGRIPSIISRHLRKSTLPEIIKSITGKKSKKLIKLVGTALTEDYHSFKMLFGILISLRGLVTIDDCQQIIKGWVRERDLYNMNWKNLRLFLSNYNRERIVILFTTPFFPFAIGDLIRQYSEHADQIELPKKPKSFNELHDYVSKEYRKLQYADYPIESIKKFKKFDNLEINQQLKLIAPTSNHQLIEWGQTLSNCIASYAKDAKQQRSQLLGVEKNNKLTYALELSPSGEIRQFYAKGNRVPDSDDAEIIRKTLAA